MSSFARITAAPSAAQDVQDMDGWPCCAATVFNRLRRAVAVSASMRSGSVGGTALKGPCAVSSCGAGSGCTTRVFAAAPTPAAPLATVASKTGNRDAGERCCGSITLATLDRAVPLTWTSYSSGPRLPRGCRISDPVVSFSSRRATS